VHTLFIKDRLAVDIGSNNIKILYGTSSAIKHFGFIKTPDGSFLDNKIVEVGHIEKVILEFLKANRVKTKDVSFTISGQDIAISHIEVPGMDKDKLTESVHWELNKNLPNNGENYYIDYQILNTIKVKNNKTHKVLAVAAPSENIDKYVELSQKLNLELKAIDLTANSMARVFSNSKGSKKNDRTIGVIDLGTKTTTIIIIENGKLFVEREVPFGRENFIREIIKRRDVDSNSALDYLSNQFNFDNIAEDDELDNRIRNLFDNVLASFQKVIQFYTTGRTQKLLDKIYITGGGCVINGIDKHVGSFLGSTTIIADSPTKINRKIKLPKGCDFKHFLGAYEG
jgi:type IV pilus assembly protein PilM